MKSNFRIWGICVVVGLPACKSLQHGSQTSATAGGSVVITLAGLKNCNEKKEEVLREFAKGNLEGIGLKLKLIARAYDIAHASILAAVEFERITGNKITCEQAYNEIGGSKLLEALRKGEAVVIRGKTINFRETAVASTRSSMMRLLQAKPEAAAGLVDAAILEFEHQTSRAQGSDGRGGFAEQRAVNAISDALRTIDGAVEANPQARRAAPHAVALNIAVETIKVATGVGLEDPTSSMRRVQDALAKAEASTGVQGEQAQARRVKVAGNAAEFAAVATAGANAERMKRTNPSQILAKVSRVIPELGPAAVQTLSTAAHHVLAESAAAHQNSSVLSRAMRVLQRSLRIESPRLAAATPANLDATLKAAESAYRSQNRYVAWVAEEYRKGRRGFSRIVRTRTGAKGIR